MRTLPQAYFFTVTLKNRKPSLLVGRTDTVTEDMHSKIRRLALTLFLFPVSVSAVERYQDVSVDAVGYLKILTTSQRHIILKKAHGQLGFDKPLISENKEVVGWLELYPNCCTSYPIPLVLVIFRNGKLAHRFTGNGLPIWRWGFRQQGSQIAFEQETVHGGSGIHFELRDVKTGRLISSYEGEAATDAPGWVRSLAR